MLNVTKESGGKSRPMPMTVMEPVTEMPMQNLDRFAAQAVREPRFFADQMSAFLAHERATVLGLRQAANLTSRDDLKRRYEELATETEQHVTDTEHLVKGLGGDPAYVSPVARMHEERATKLMETALLGGSVDVKTLEISCLECVHTAIGRAHANWELLGKLAGKMTDGQVKSTLEKTVKRIEQKKDEHEKWTSSTWERVLTDEIL